MERPNPGRVKVGGPLDRARYGIVAQFQDPLHAEQAGRLGVGSARFGLEWRELEGDDQRTELDWHQVDENLDYAVGQLGLEAYVGLGGHRPRWAIGDPADFRKELSYWEEYVEAVIDHALTRVEQRYPDAKLVFGIWNEPDNPGFLPDDPDADFYALLFQHASIARDRVALKHARPVRLGGPDTMHNALGRGYLAKALGRMRPYLEESDVITVHWYNDPNMSLGEYMSRVSALAPGRELWLTETGYPTYDDALQSLWLWSIMAEFDRTPLNWTKTFVYRLNWGVPEALTLNGGGVRKAFNTYRDIIATDSAPGRD